MFVFVLIKNIYTWNVKLSIGNVDVVINSIWFDIFPTRAVLCFRFRPVFTDSSLVSIRCRFSCHWICLLLRGWLVMIGWLVLRASFVCSMRTALIALTDGLDRSRCGLLQGYRDTLLCSSCSLLFIFWFLLSFFLVGRTVSGFGSAVGFFPRRSVVHVKGRQVLVRYPE